MCVLKIKKVHWCQLVDFKAKCLKSKINIFKKGQMQWLKLNRQLLNLEICLLNWLPWFKVSFGFTDWAAFYGYLIFRAEDSTLNFRARRIDNAYRYERGRVWNEYWSSSWRTFKIFPFGHIKQVAYGQDLCHGHCLFHHFRCIFCLNLIPWPIVHFILVLRNNNYVLINLF